MSLRDLGKPGEVLLACFDLVPVVMDEMKTGYIQLTIDQQPFLQGYVPIHELHLINQYKLGTYDVNTCKARSRPTRWGRPDQALRARRSLTPSRAPRQGGPRSPFHAVPGRWDSFLARPEISALSVGAVAGFRPHAPQFAETRRHHPSLVPVDRLGSES